VRHTEIEIPLHLFRGGIGGKLTAHVTPFARDAPSRGKPARPAEIFSEMKLLKSGDLLERVVIEAGLAGGVDQTRSDPTAVARAVRRLQSRLAIAPVRKTAVTHVTYESRDPERAARVLSVRPPARRLPLRTQSRSPEIVRTVVGTTANAVVTS
jgi:hypothetical protein